MPACEDDEECDGLYCCPNGACKSNAEQCGEACVRLYVVVEFTVFVVIRGYLDLLRIHHYRQMGFPTIRMFLFSHLRAVRCIHITIDKGRVLTSSGFVFDYPVFVVFIISTWCYVRVVSVQSPPFRLKYG